LLESLKGQISNRLICGQIDGGRDRDRTGDPLLAKQVLSQLSYTPILWQLHYFTLLTLQLQLLIRPKFWSILEHNKLEPRILRPLDLPLLTGHLNARHSFSLSALRRILIGP
jgi:hypothetical protein